MDYLKVTVFWVVLCVLKCSAMSLDEIEDFKNFLEKTSQLNQILVKKGHIPDEDTDEEESISDDAWEQSGKFEGDLILNDRQRRVIVEDVAEGLSRNGLKDITKRWPDNEVVYYIQREHFNSDQVQAIQDGIDDLAQASCVKFRPYKKGDRDAVVIQGSRRGCFSQVGYQGGYQVLNLNGRHPPGRGCFRHGTVVHELLHTLGFYHMQSSPDRDDYIDVMWDNIHEPAKHNFRKYNTFSVSDFGVGYDYDSVLHYGRRAFSRNGQDTLVPKHGGASIGQRIQLSDKDVKKLNKMYCDGDSNDSDAPDKRVDKPTNKKASRKNEPFQGHGIGYDKGNTIVIKLPAAETYKLSNTPQFHLFDHFSKTPEAVSQTFTEGVGAGKELVTNKYDPGSYNMNDYIHLADGKTDEINRKHKTRYEIYGEEKYDINDKTITKDIDTVTQKNEFNDNSSKNELLNFKDSDDGKEDKHNGTTKEAEQEIEQEYSAKTSDDVDDAFDRLGKIIKTHVYPSQTPNLEVYKTNFDYSKFYNSHKEIKSKPQMKIAIDKENNSAEKENESEREKLESPELTMKKEKPSSYIPEFPYHNNYLPKEYDSSYGTSYPLNKMPIVKKEKFVTPDYATYKHLAHKHDYSDYYNPKEKYYHKKRKNTLFGYLVPLPDTKVIEIKNDNEKYYQDKYTHLPDDEIDNISSKLTEHDTHDDEDNSFVRPIDKKAYSLFGVLVPLTQKWYRIEYNPHRDIVSESSEDHR